MASKDGEYLWACCNDGTIVIWEIKVGASQWRRVLERRKMILVFSVLDECLTKDRGGDLVRTLGFVNNVGVEWNLRWRGCENVRKMFEFGFLDFEKTGEVVATRQAHKATIFELVCVSNEMNPLAKSEWTMWAACMDSTVTLWNPSLSAIKKLSLGSYSATSIVAVGRMVFVADAKQIFVFDSQSYDLVKKIDLPQLEHLMAGQEEGAEPSGEDGGGKKKLGLHTVISRSSALSGSRSGEEFSGYFVRCMVLVEKWVWVCTDGFICFVEVSTLSIVPSVCVPIPKINSLAYVPATQQVWGACSDSSIYVWDCGAPLQTGFLTASAQLSGFSHDRISRLVLFENRYIFSGSWDKKLRIWDVFSHALLYTSSKNHECPIMSILPIPYPWLKIKPEADIAKRRSPNNASSDAHNHTTEDKKLTQEEKSDKKLTQEEKSLTDKKLIQEEKSLAEDGKSLQVGESQNQSQLPSQNQSQFQSQFQSQSQSQFQSIPKRETLSLPPSLPTTTSPPSQGRLASASLSPSTLQSSPTILPQDVNDNPSLSSSTLSSSSLPSDDLATIWTVFTADWSTVSVWV